jgi:translation initiation factor 1 (eIF-1/SUI1)
VKRKRGAKKNICLIVGLELYGVSLKDASKIMGKKFACGASITADEKHGECIQV